MSDTTPETDTPQSLRRRLTLPLLVLYGLGVTVGAGIYVLVGLTAAEAGLYAPASFLLAAGVVSFTGYSYAELSTRFPVSAGEAAYAQNAFGSKQLALVIGLLVVIVGLVSSATIAIGASAYLRHFLPLPAVLLTVLIICLLGVIAALGVLESVSIAAAFTIIELLGLALVVVYGSVTAPHLYLDLPALVPPPDLSVWSGIASAALIAFFAFVGFEDLANVAEEAVEPGRNLPRAILLTLVIATSIYLLVVSVVVLTVPMERLQSSAAPLTLIFADHHRPLADLLSLIAGVTTLNGVLIQMIMASRVLYGLARQGDLPEALAYVHPRTRTPLLATGIVALITLTFALFLPIARLAELTSSLVLVVFIMVNASLVRLKAREKAPPEGIYRVPVLVPVIGVISCSLLLVAGLL